ncbi:MAG: ClpXP protease specificity-enhancing factor [Halieaceae bacterium]
MSMTSSRPYVMRALYEWILDNECTPYVLVNAEEPGVDVPRQYVKDGQIVLNVSPAAVVDLVIENESLHFNGRFGGVPIDVFVPMVSVIGIYARENGQGMVFDGEDSPWPEPPSDPEPGPGGDGATPSPPGSKRPALKVVK